MNLISLGNACKVRESIDRYNGAPQPTHIFDWVISDFDAVVEIIKSIANDEEILIFNENSFINEGSHPNLPSHLCLSHKTLNFKSIHDVEVDKDYQTEYNLFINKYLRRAIRLRELVKNENSAIHFIYFICYEENIPSIEQIYYFIINIQKIRDKKPFFIHILIPPELSQFKKQIEQIGITEHVKFFYMTSFSNIDPVKEQRQDLNWYNLYNNIKNSCY